MARKREQEKTKPNQTKLNQAVTQGPPPTSPFPTRRVSSKKNTDTLVGSGSAGGSCGLHRPAAARLEIGGWGTAVSDLVLVLGKDEGNHFDDFRQFARNSSCHISKEYGRR